MIGSLLIRSTAAWVETCGIRLSDFRTGEQGWIPQLDETAGTLAHLHVPNPIVLMIVFSYLRFGWGRDLQEISELPIFAEPTTYLDLPIAAGEVPIYINFRNVVASR